MNITKWTWKAKAKQYRKELTDTRRAYLGQEKFYEWKLKREEQANNHQYLTIRALREEIEELEKELAKLRKIVLSNRFAATLKMLDGEE